VCRVLVHRPSLTIAYQKFGTPKKAQLQKEARRHSNTQRQISYPQTTYTHSYYPLLDTFYIDMARTKQKSSDDLKRKRDDKEDISTLATKKAATSPSLSTEIDEKNGTTKRGPRKLNKPPDTIDIDEAIGHMDNNLLADHFVKQIRRHLGDLSTAELDEKHMPLKAFLNTSEFESTRNLSTLPQYIEKFTPGGRDELKDTVEATSSPHTLFIASSGIRAADLTRFVEPQ
jgi:hypothetical protein